MTAPVLKASPRRMLLVFAVLAAAADAVAAGLTDRFPGDLAVSHWLQGFHAERWRETMRTVSQAGSTPVLLGIAAAAAIVLVARGRRFWVLALPIAGSSAVLVPILKYLVDRPRPTPDVVQVLTPERSASFPSGHVFGAVVVLGALFYLAGQLCGPSRWTVLAFRAILVAAVLLIGISRVYLGVHWASDVVGGYLMGGLSLLAAIWTFEALARARQFPHRSPSPAP